MLRPALIGLAAALALGTAVIPAAASGSDSLQATKQTAITPSYAQLAPGQSASFTAPDGGAVIWEVDNQAGGSTQAGTITQQGVYTAPATTPAPASAVVSAVSVSDPSVSANATVTLLQAAPKGATYAVATNGNDAAPGTLAAPWRTIQHAAATVVAGDTVLVRGGVYNELVAPIASGNPAAGFITFSSYPGETAIVDGTGLPVPGGQHGLFTLTDASYVVVQGFELRNYSSASRNEVPVGIYVTGAGSNVQLVGNHVHDITTTAKTTPKQCASNALGVAVYGSRAPASIEGLAVSGNEIDHLHTGCSESMSLDGNVEHFVVTANRVHDNDNIGIDAIGFERVSPDPAYDQARDGEIRGNTVFAITSYENPDYGKQYAADGIYVDGGTRITIEQNTVHDVDLGIELASEHKGRLTSAIVARNNLIYSDTSNGISVGGYGRNRGGSDGITIVGNTLYGNDTKHTGSGEFQIQWNTTNVSFFNNIVYAGPQALFVHGYVAGKSAPATLGYNLYFNPKGAAKGIWQWLGKRYTGFSTYTAASSQDVHSLFADPKFIDLAKPDLRLQAGSPGLRAGDDLGAAIVGAFDIAGESRVVGGSIDLGAYERQ